MHEFLYCRNELYCEKVRISDILKKVGTPAYIYSHKTLVDHIRKIKKAFRSLSPLICYSVKANSNLAVLKALVKHGAGLDIVSSGELYRARRVGCDPEKIVFAGVGKTESEIEAALRFGILLFNVESVPELELIDRVARRLKKKARVSLRLNPGVDPHTHAHIATGKSESKFGLDFQTAAKIFRARKCYPSVCLDAVHVHIGSQIVSGGPFKTAVGKVLAFIDRIEKEDVKIRYLNLGGGLGAIYRQEEPQTAFDYARNILPLLAGRKFRLIFEPGRFVSANAGILAARVLYVKTTGVKKFAIVDAGMNDLIRPLLYDAYHEILPLICKSGEGREVYDVVGPICESGDFFAKDRRLKKLSAGDSIAIMSAGAYGFVMASNYNSRPRACEVLVKGSRFAVIRRRENYASLVAGESVPNFV